MKTNQKGINIIKSYEKFSSKPYLCPAGKPTIGYGTTYYPNGRKVTLSDKPISRTKAIQIFRAILSEKEKAVQRFLKMPLNSNQFSALVSLTYNIGIEAFRTSTLLKKVNRSPDNPRIKNEFLRWVYSNGRKLRGLERRRIEEAQLYFNYELRSIIN